jgi:hypothetical protein
LTATRRIRPRGDRLNTIAEAVEIILRAQEATQKPLGVILAGHNSFRQIGDVAIGAGRSAGMPLINADRMMLSILPEPGEDRQLVAWAARLRDQDPGWMRVAQQGVQAFVGHAIAEQVPFAMETVFSYCEERPDGRVASKIDLITNLQAAGYFVLLAFVGLRGRLDQSRGDAGAGGWARRPGRDPAAAVSQDANGDCRGAEGCGRLDPGRQPPDAG